MSEVAVSALAGCGSALVLVALIGALEAWWEPSWRATQRTFHAVQNTPPIAAGAGFGAHLYASSSVNGHIATATLAWALVSLVLPALRRRTYPPE